MILFLYGPDSYRRQQRISVFQDAFTAKHDPEGVNSATVSGLDFDINAFRTHTHSAGLFAEKRFVLLTSLWSLSKEQQEQILEELDTVSEDTILCISADAPPRKNNKLFKRLLKADTVEEYAELKPAELSAFVRDEAAKYGAEIDNDAVQELGARIGTDLWRMHHEVKKLAHQGNKVTAEMVRAQIDDAFEDSIFALTDALGSKNMSTATKLLEEHMANGAHEHYLVRMLARHIAILLQIKKTDGGDGLKLHPFVLQKSSRQAEQFTGQQLLNLHWKLMELDQSMKSGKDGRPLLDLFLVEACTK